MQPDDEQLDAATEAALTHLRSITYLRCGRGELHVLTDATMQRLARGMARSILEVLDVKL